MANLTVTVAVATGTQYQVGGSGNVFTFDGSQPASYTFPWVNGATVRLEQSGSTNDGHPLIFSTSNSTVLATMRTGIISSGVTYYLDGSSNQSDYTNTTTFNAATTRYIEIAPSDETDFYFACWVHGISMGGIVDLTQNTWGALSWGNGEWSEQNEAGIAVTGQVITSSVGTADAFNSEGWGRETWSSGDWGTTGTSVQVDVTAQTITSGIGTPVVEDDIEVGWGRKTWGNLAWGDAYSALVTGQQITSALGSVTTKANAKVHPTALTITSGYGLVDIEADATYVHVQAPQITSAVGSAIGFGQPVIVTGVQITSAIGVGQAVGGVDVEVTGQAITSSVGSPRTFTDITVTPTAQTITSAIGIARQISSVEVQGQSITSALGSITGFTDVVVKPTAQTITASVGVPGIRAYSDVDTGTPTSYSNVDTGTATSYTDVNIHQAA